MIRSARARCCNIFFLPGWMERRKRLAVCNLVHVPRFCPWLKDLASQEGEKKWRWGRRTSKVPSLMSNLFFDRCRRKTENRYYDKKCSSDMGHYFSFFSFPENNCFPFCRELPWVIQDNSLKRRNDTLKCTLLSRNYRRRCLLCVSSRCMM